jgi:hypothetical protein
MLSLQGANGMILNAQGLAEALPTATWERLRRVPVAVGGPM